MAGLDVLSNVLTNPPTDEFDFAKDNLGEIYAIILCLGNEKRKIAIYKKQAPFKILRRRGVMGRVIRLIPTDSQLIELEKDVVEIGSSFDFVQYENDLLVVNLGTLEKHFGFDAVVQSIATETVRSIGKLNYIADSAILENFLSNKALAKKLMRLRRDSPVFDLDFEVVKKFIENHSTLNGQFKFSEDGRKIELSSKAAVVRFVKLLDDDYLMSQLTNIDYDVELKEVLAAAAAEAETVLPA